MESIQIEIRTGAYYDSIVLMQLQQELASLPQILDSGVVMGTPTNKELLAQSGLLLKQAENAKGDDLIIAVKASSEESAKHALSQVDNFLNRKRSVSGQDYSPKSIETAISMLPSAQWVLVSVPGKHAADVSREALRFHRHVFLYSDNVTLEEEKSLKEEAIQKGLLVMGPDCGTAIIQGIGLGFANKIRKGNIGVVAASGTGLQTITSRIHQKGAGISHAIGTGGRDLSEEIGAITARQGLSLLQKDPQTQVIVFISKPPGAKVAQSLIHIAKNLGKPVVINFLGYPCPTSSIENVYFTNTLEKTVQKAVELSQNLPKTTACSYDLKGFHPEQKYLRGLFSGGTLGYEALFFLRDYLPCISSNMSIPGIQSLKQVSVSQGHTVIDLGADEFMVGRLHPMINQDTRLRRILQEARDPECAMLLLDVVLGYGAHNDPASELAPAIVQAKELAKSNGRRLDVVAMLIGTDEDPQSLQKQEKQLLSSGAVVFKNSEEASCYAASLTASLSKKEIGLPAMNLEILNTPFAAINVGIQSFSDSLIAQNAASIHLDWKPPCSGNERLKNLLKKMK